MLFRLLSGVFGLLLICAPAVAVLGEARAGLAEEDRETTGYRADFAALVGDWFVYARNPGHDPPGCTAVRQEWGVSLYLSVRDGGWRLGTDALFGASGSHSIVLNGLRQLVRFAQEQGLPQFAAGASVAEALQTEGSYISFAPEAQTGTFSLHQSDAAMKMVALCEGASGRMPDPAPPPIPSLAADCPDLTDYVPRYGAEAEVTLINERDAPVQLYLLSQYKERPELLGTLQRQHVLQSALGTLYVVTDLSGHCLGDPLEVREESQQIHIR